LISCEDGYFGAAGLRWDAENARIMDKKVLTNTTSYIF